MIALLDHALQDTRDRQVMPVMSPDYWRARFHAVLAGQPLTRNGIAYILAKYATVAAHDNPPVLRRHIAPRALPHSCAEALLQSGTDGTLIRNYLGPSSGSGGAEERKTRPPRSVRFRADRPARCQKAVSPDVAVHSPGLKSPEGFRPAIPVG